MLRSSYSEERSNRDLIIRSGEGTKTRRPMVKIAWLTIGSREAGKVGHALSPANPTFTAAEGPTLEA
jgi:hypothetical protein